MIKFETRRNYILETVTKNLIFCGVLAEVKTIDSYLYSDGRSNAVQFRPIHYYDLLKQVGLLK